MMMHDDDDDDGDDNDAFGCRSDNNNILMK